MLLIALLSVLLLGAVIYDMVSHRLPNYYLLLGLLVGLYCQVSMVGWSGLRIGGGGLLAGFVIFLPLYILRGMAAGDVKLMAVVGSFLDFDSALWAAALSLIAGGAFGVIYLIYKNSLGLLVVRYWAMVSTRASMPAAVNDPARHRFPYALAIAAGTYLSVYWVPI